MLRREPCLCASAWHPEDTRAQTRSQYQIPKSPARAQTRNSFPTSVRKLQPPVKFKGNPAQTSIRARPSKRSDWHSLNEALRAYGVSLQVLNRDPKAAEKAPNVLKNGARDPGSKPQTRSFSTSARRLSEMMQYAPESRPIARSGHTFELPELPLPEHSHLKSKYRTVDIIHQVTRLIMQDGKLAKAERVCFLEFRRGPPPATLCSHWAPPCRT